MLSPSALSARPEREEYLTSSDENKVRDRDELVLCGV
jgi:hypothetical protein